VDPCSWDLTEQAFFGTFAYIAFVFGLSLLLLPALVGKADFLRFFFGGEIWNLLTNIGYCVYMFCPLMCLSFYLTLGTDVHVDYQMMFYNFCGNFIFSVICSLILAIFIDRPILSAFLMKFDLKMAYYGKNQFDIDKYKLDSSELETESDMKQSNNGDRVEGSKKFN